MASVKGAAVLARVGFIKERFGQPGYERVLQELEPALRQRLEQLPLPQEWLPVELIVRLIDTADRVLGAGDGAFIREMARHAAEANLTTLYRIFFRITSASYVLGKAKQLWNLHYDSGSLELEEHSPTHFSLSIVDFAEPHCTHCKSVFAWAERSVELSGGSNTSVHVTKCRKNGAQKCECKLAFK